MTFRAIVIPGGILTLTAVARVADDAGLTPAGFWPVTFVGWLSALGTIAALVASGYALHKFSQKALFERLARMEEHFDGEIAELKQHYDREILELRDMQEREMNALSSALKDRLDGFGLRLRESEDQNVSLGTILSGVVTQMASSIEDRRHINAQLGTIIQTQERIITDRSNFERQMMQMIANVGRLSQG